MVSTYVTAHNWFCMANFVIHFRFKVYVKTIGIYETVCFLHGSLQRLHYFEIDFDQYSNI